MAELIIGALQNTVKQAFGTKRYLPVENAILGNFHS